MGRVESVIGFVGESFLAARRFVDLDDVNAQAALWCAGPAADRPCREEPTISVREAFAREQPSLLALPENPYPCELQLAVKVGKTPYVRFDLNDYTIPHTHVRRTLTVRADPRQVRILDGADLLATHERSYDRGAQIEIAAHIDALVARKREARHHRGLDHLSRAARRTRSETLQAGATAGRLWGLRAHGRELTDAGGVAPLLQWEEDERARRSLERRIRDAHLGSFKALCDFDWTWPSRCDRLAI